MKRWTKNLWKRWIYHASPIWKASLSAGIAWQLAQFTSTTRPYFAPLAAILCTQATVAESVTRGYQRVLGILGGIILADMTAKFIGVNALSIALLVLVGTGLATILKLGQQATPQVGVSAMMVLTIGIGLHNYAFDRLVETVIGAIVAVLVNMFVFPPDFTMEAEVALIQAADELESRFAAIAAWLKEGAPPDEAIDRKTPTQNYINRLHEASHRIDRALVALRYNPLVKGRAGDLFYLREDLEHLRKGYAHATGMVRTLVEWRSSGMTQTDMFAWQVRFSELAHVIRHWKSAAVVSMNREQTESELQMTLEETSANLSDLYNYSLMNDARQMLEDFRVFGHKG